MPKKNRLTPKELTSVSLVDKGDNPEARVVIFKRDVEAGKAPDDESPAVEKDGSGSSGDYECPACGDDFDSRDALDSHMQSEHPEDDALEKAATKTEGGVSFPKSAYAYTPSDQPSDWKLRLWETPEEKETPAQVGRAVAALGKGFRGEKVQIPEGDVGAVKAKVKAAWNKVNPGKDASDMPEVLKSDSGGGAVGGLVAAIGKKLGWSKEEAKAVAKDTLTYEDEDGDMAEDLGDLIEGGDDDDADPDDPDDFNQALREQRSHYLMGAVYERVDALCSALDEQMDAGSDDSALQSVVDQFAASLKTAIPGVLSGVAKAGAKVSADRLQRLKDAHGQLGGLIDEVDPSKKTANPPKGDSPPKDAPDDKEKKAVTKTDTIDKSALSPEVLAYVEELEKKAEQTPEEPGEDPILKGLEGQTREIMKREIAKREALEAEFAKLAETREQEEMIRKVTSEFGSIPGKASELAESLRKMDEETRASMEAVLKATNQAIVEGDFFGEIGKIGSAPGGTTPVAKLDAAASEIRKHNPELTPEQAFDAAVQQHPELKSEYRNELLGGVS